MKVRGIVLAGLIGCSPAEETSAPCEPVDVNNIAVASSDVYGAEPFAMGYPPYAIDGCTLVYVRPDGALILRERGSGAHEEMLAPASDAPRRPALAGDVIAWEATLAGADVVQMRDNGAIVTATGPFMAAREPRAAADAIVFTGWLGAAATDDTDVFVLPVGASEATLIAGGSGQQRFADISTTHVAYTDFSEDPDGAFHEDADLADIGVVERASGRVIARPLAEKQAFPLLTDDGLVYLHWVGIPPEPKLSEYDLRAGIIDQAAEADATIDHVVTNAPYIRPAAEGALLDWVQWPPDQQAVLWRGPIDNVADPQALVSAAALYGPAAAPSMTIYAAPGADGALWLQAISR